jgi:pyruvate dehydrogenase E2 component (dihydrolipoamide acetyltransferase)
MAKEVILPKFGFTQEDSQIVEWFVKEGDEVEAGEPLLEVTTDKVNMEIEAPASGIVGGIRAGTGETVPVTQVIAYILEPGEKAPPIVEALPAAAGATPVAARMAAASSVDPESISGTGARGRVTRKDVERYLGEGPDRRGKVRATPAARRVAREDDVDLATVSGSGPHGRLQVQDVASAAAAPSSATPTIPPVAAGELVRVPFSTMRRTIARKLQHTVQEAPHVTFQVNIDMAAIQSLMANANDRHPAGTEKISLTAVLTRAVAWTLARHPRLNSHLGQEELILWPVANIGIAVALDDGLIVPVVKDAGRKGIARLSNDIRELVRRSRQGQLRPEELADGTFTISNLGMFGVDRFTAIIHSPQVAILAVGRTNRVFVPDAHDRPVVRPLCTMTLSVDHRVIDGAEAARFMSDLREVAQAPELMLL